MNVLALLGFTFDVIGKLLVAYTAIRVHHRVWQEHRVDRAVFLAMRREQWLGGLGMALILIGYLLQLPDKLGRL